MKYLKTYETAYNVNNLFGDWTIDKLVVVENEKTYIEKCLCNFLTMKNIDIIYVADFDISNNRIHVNYHTPKSGETFYKIKGDEYSEFILYLNNHDAYKDMIKFNI